MSSSWSKERYEADFDTSRASLPIYKYKDDLIEAIKEFQILIVVGDTGSGKTTQLPQYINEAFSDKRIIVTQPRRIAAISASTRVADEMGEKVGANVGYSIRFESVKSSHTKILYMTDGALLRTAATDPTLVSNADIVILDEAHERSLETDVLFGLLKRAVKERPELKLVIMSATLDMDKFSSFFDEAPVFTVPGRMYGVELFYATKVKMGALKSQFVTKAVEAIVHIHKSEEPGDILVFLTGQQDIETCCRRIIEESDKLRSSEIKHYPSIKHLTVHPIYSALDTIEQKEVFRPAREGHRKVVVATNIAQTSVTIPGIRYVVDSGFVKEKMFDPQTGVDALLVTPISKSAATQRAGRAGRTAPGKVFRLYSREAFEDMDKDTTPEIQRSSLIGTVISLKKMGIDDVLRFEFLDPPDTKLLIMALKQLFYLGAIDEFGKLTPLGRKMSDLPTSPFVSRSLIAACEQFGCGEEWLTLAAMLSSEDIFVSPRTEAKRVEAEGIHSSFSHKSGDHVALLRIFAAFTESGDDPSWCRARYLRYRALRSARNVRKQLEEIVRGLGLKLTSCRIPSRSRPDQSSSQSRRSRGKHRNDDPEGEEFVMNDYLEDYNATPILQALSSGFFLNTAKRHTQKPFFYHYLGATGSTNSEVNLNKKSIRGDGDDSMTGSPSFLSLHIHPSSCLADLTTHANRSVEWVVYNDVQYINRANMRIVSRIDFSWVNEGLARVSGCDVRKLIETSGGEVSSPTKRESGDDNGVKNGKKRRRSSVLAVQDSSGEGDAVEVKDAHPESKKLNVMPSVSTPDAGVQEANDREARVNEAKARYLARKKK
ncbi:hypothetical protein HDU76_006600 [Blyttiomyces sp. JEL0837]|nr:hypothetical protein HDU76_006600 [Blyttiomyces sp. JEL0837]